MERLEFIEWFNYNIGTVDKWGEYQTEVNYEPQMTDYYEIDVDSITYMYDELSWGSTDTVRRKYSFKEFIEAHEKGDIKNYGEEIY